jgi:hypothetical protein
MEMTVRRVTTSTGEADHRCEVTSAHPQRTPPAQACACADRVAAVSLEDAWRMVEGTTTVFSGPLRSLPIRRMTSPDSATSIA